MFGFISTFENITVESVRGCLAATHSYMVIHYVPKFYCLASASSISIIRVTRHGKRHKTLKL